MSSNRSWTERLESLRARGVQRVAQYRGVSAIEALERPHPEEAIVASDGSYSYAEAAYRARMLGLSLRSRGFGRDFIAVWDAGGSREWLVAMAGVGGAGGVWVEGTSDEIPPGTAVVFYAGSAPELAPGIVAVSIDDGELNLAKLIAEGGILAGLDGLWRNWKTLWFVDDRPVHRWAPGAFVSLGSLRVEAGHRVGDLTDFAASSLAHAQLLHGGTLVFEGEADPPQNRVYGTPRTGLVTVLRSDEFLGHPESVGRAFPGTDVWIVGPDGGLLGASEIGDIWVGHPDVIVSPGVPSGFAATGDRGSIDADGFLYLEAQ
jgi:hypothetical protein